MKVLRTPDERFAALDGFPFEPRYAEVDAGDGTPLRIHYVDEGPREAEPLLLMHGNPTWSYLYRHMIPGLVAGGCRVVAPDLVGCGRSDKPASRGDYTVARHVAWMSAWLEAVDLRGATLFCQDWGGTIGLHLVAAFPDRFARVVAANTGMPLGEGETEFLKMWVGMFREATTFPWHMLPQGMGRELRASELEAYRAPFPDPAYESALLSFPSLIAAQPDNPGVAANRAAWEKLRSFPGPVLTLWGQRDPVARGVDRRLQEHFPGAAGQAHHRFAEANHFLQEDVPAELVERLLAFVAATRSATEAAGRETPR